MLAHVSVVKSDHFLLYTLASAVSVVVGRASPVNVVLGRVPADKAVEGRASGVRAISIHPSRH